jgi:alkyl hydroperoxide reductase subunit AhpC
VKQIEEIEGTKFTYPIIDDSSKNVATQFGMLHPADMSKSTVRSLFIINPERYGLCRLLRLSQGQTWQTLLNDGSDPIATES